MRAEEIAGASGGWAAGWAPWSGRSGDPRPGRLIQSYRPLCGLACSRPVTLTIGIEGIPGGLVIARVGGAAVAV